jgi:hypothetical protein
MTVFLAAPRWSSFRRRAKLLGSLVVLLQSRHCITPITMASAAMAGVKLDVVAFESITSARRWPAVRRQGEEE